MNRAQNQGIFRAEREARVSMWENLHSQISMEGSRPDSYLFMAPQAAATEAEAERGLSEIEQEVVELFDDLRTGMLRYLLSFSLSVLDAEDLLQETFLALFHHLRAGKPRQNLRGWLFRVAHNLALKHQRSERNSKVVAEPGGVPGRYLVSPTANPEDQYIALQTTERVMSVVAALPEQTRWCLQLRTEGLRYREIAEVLDISLGSVCGCLEQALSKIARATER